jgi:(2R)-ethylmalonyl-CoA mutase
MLARGEVGKVGVPVAHLGDMRTLFDQIPLEQMNTSMTINATAPWLLALYIAVAEEQGGDVSKLQGTVQNDIIKEYLSRGTYICPPKPSLRMIADVASLYLREHLPKWNPMNVCSYHLQEAGATPEQELAFALATATAVLDDLRRAVRPDEDFPVRWSAASRSSSTPASASSPRCARCAPSSISGTRSAETRYGVTDPKYRRFRYGVQVNSLGLTEQQPENNVYRILLEMLAVTLSKKARARAVQLPAWNEALGLPRPWDQQWSLRMQQILAFETDLLEYGDLFDGNPAVDAKVEELKEGARAELANRRHGRGDGGDRLHEGRLVESNAERGCPDRERGETVVVGVNKYHLHAEPSPADLRRGWRHHGRRPGGGGRPDRAAEAWRAPRRRGREGRAGRNARGGAERARTSCRPPSPRRRPA